MKDDWFYIQKVFTNMHWILWNRNKIQYNTIQNMCSWLYILINLLTPNVNYSGRTAPLTSEVAFYIHLFIQQI